MSKDSPSAQGSEQQADDDGYDYLLEAAYEALEESGFHDLRVSGYEDMTEPDPIADGIIPDLTARNQKGMLFVFEICPTEALVLMELAERLHALAGYAETSDAQLVLIVPEGDIELAAAFVAEHQIPENRLTIWEA